MALSIDELNSCTLEAFGDEASHPTFRVDLHVTVFRMQTMCLRMCTYTVEYTHPPNK